MPPSLGENQTIQIQDPQDLKKLEGSSWDYPYEIKLSDMITWIITAGGAIALIFIVYRPLIKIGKSQAAVSRQDILHTLECDIQTILNAKFAVEDNGVQNDTEKDWRKNRKEFRFVLDNEPRWHYEPDTNSPSIANHYQPISDKKGEHRLWQIRIK